MLATVVHTAQAKVAHTAQTAVLGLAAGLLLTIGLGFMTLASWMLLVTLTTPLNAALILGSVFLGLACVVFAIISIRSRKTVRPVVPPVVPAQGDILNQIVVTFLAGLTAGRKTRL